MTSRVLTVVLLGLALSGCASPRKCSYRKSSETRSFEPSVPRDPAQLSPETERPVALGAIETSAADTVEAALAVLRESDDEELRASAFTALISSPDRSRLVVPRLALELSRIAASPPWGGARRPMGDSLEWTQRQTRDLLAVVVKLGPDAAPLIDQLIVLELLRARSPTRLSGDRSAYAYLASTFAKVGMSAYARLLDSHDADVRLMVIGIVAELEDWPPGLEAKCVRSLLMETDLASASRIMDLLGRRGVREADARQALQEHLEWLRAAPASTREWLNLPPADAAARIEALLASGHARR